MTSISLVGVPVDCGSRRAGCLMGPDALRVAGLQTALEDLGHQVADLGTVRPAEVAASCFHPNPSLYQLDACASWVRAIQEGVRSMIRDDTVPLFMGGDHLMAAGTISSMAAHAQRLQRPLFVLWLDAHTDFHSLESTQSGHLHGTPVAYVTGQDGFEGGLPRPAAIVPVNHFCMMGIRSVDAAERRTLSQLPLDVIDMRTIDEQGVARPLSAFLERVHAANGMLHLSFDVDFLDPEIAPAVGTTCPGGATFREAHLIMEILHDSALVTSLDLAELNPFLDQRGRTAKLLVDLVSSLFGKRVMDRPTRSY